MKKVLQYGEGNFLRSFVDLYFETLNREGGEWAVEIVKPIIFGSLDAFARQGNRYHVVLRGVKDGNAAETVYPVSVVEQAISPFDDFPAYAALAVDPELAVIVSNTTEAGICYHEGDSFDGFAEITYPAKLTKFLYARFKAGLSGVYLLPVELIENNADVVPLRGEVHRPLAAARGVPRMEPHRKLLLQYAGRPHRFGFSARRGFTRKALETGWGAGRSAVGCRAVRALGHREQRKDRRSAPRRTP